MKEYLYEKKIVILIDHLGFKNELKGGTSLAVLVNRLESLKSLFNKDFINKKNGEIFYIGDALVIALDFNNANDAYQNFLYIALVVGTYMFAGIPIRGAICYGDYFRNNEYFLSPAFLKAYSLEKNESKYLRIIVDIEVLNMLQFDYKIPNEDINKFLKKDKDGYYFINYLQSYGLVKNDTCTNRSSIESISESFSKLKMHICAHKQILERYFDDEKNKEYKEKYQWLAHYHNDFINSYASDQKNELEDYLIKVSSI